MRFFIVDDDAAIRCMLAEMIEDCDLGEVVGEAENGSLIQGAMLNMSGVDILIIDLLMPVRDGIQTIREMGDSFNGKIIMISQVENKDMIGEAYSLGIEYFITKPINRLEVIAVIQKVKEYIQLQRSIEYIQNALNGLSIHKAKEKTEYAFAEKGIRNCGQFLLSELGIIGESGSRDLLDMLEYLYEKEKGRTFDHEFPSLKDIFTGIAIRKLGDAAKTAEINKEVKASEQRVRRAIAQAVNHIASLGLTDYSNPKFEEYAAIFFDFTEVRRKMRMLEDDFKDFTTSSSVNMKKFVKVLFIEAKKRM